jgi:hypothetical protein
LPFVRDHVSIALSNVNLSRVINRLGTGFVMPMPGGSTM